MKKWGVFLAILFAFSVTLIAPISTSAQEQPSPVRRLQISPLHTFISIEPGSSYTGSVIVENIGTEPLSVSLSAEAFEVQNEQYDYTFLPDSSINSWVRFIEPELTLKPNQMYDAKFLISVPIEAEPGGAYLSIFASSLPNESSAIQSTERVGSLFYINLAGDSTQKGELLRFSAPWIHGGDTVTWSATLRNAGSTHFNADYTVTLENIFGGTISQNKDDPLILPRSVRGISNTLESPRWIGIYKINYTFDLGDNESVNKVQYLIYTPLVQLIPLLLILGAVALLAQHYIKKYKRRKS